MKRRPIVGETLFDLNVGNAARGRAQILTPVEVISVGCKYFTCAPKAGAYRPETRYKIDDWREENSGYSPNHALYETEQEWLDQKEAHALRNKIRKTFDVYGDSKIPLDTLRAIQALLAPFTEAAK